MDWSNGFVFYRLWAGFLEIYLINLSKSCTLFNEYQLSRPYILRSIIMIALVSMLMARKNIRNILIYNPDEIRNIKHKINLEEKETQKRYLVGGII